MWPLFARAEVNFIIVQQTSEYGDKIMIYTTRLGFFFFKKCVHNSEMYSKYFEL